MIENWFVNFKAAIQTLKMPWPKTGNDTEKHRKRSQNHFGKPKSEVAGDNWYLTDIKGTYSRHFVWTFVHKKDVFKMGGTFAHSEPKTTMFWNFFHRCDNDQTWIHHYTTEWNRQSARSTRPKTQQLASKEFCSKITLKNATQSIAMVNLRGNRKKNKEKYIDNDHSTSQWKRWQKYRNYTSARTVFAKFGYFWVLPFHRQ